MVRKIPYLIPLFVLVVLVWGMAYALLSGIDPAHVSSARLDKPVPEFTLPVFEARDAVLTTQDFKTTQGPVLVNFFASWCLPCKAEHAQLLKLAEKGVRIYGIAYKDDPEKLKTWLVKNPYFRTGLDASGRVAIDWGVSRVPETFVIDSEGIIRHQHSGPVLERDVETVILPLLREAGQ